LTKTKHDKHFEMLVEAQYMRSYIVKWSFKNWLGARFTIHFT